MENLFQISTSDFIAIIAVMVSVFLLGAKMSDRGRASLEGDVAEMKEDIKYLLKKVSRIDGFFDKGKGGDSAN